MPATNSISVFGKARKVRIKKMRYNNNARQGVFPQFFSDPEKKLEYGGSQH